MSVDRLTGMMLNARTLATQGGHGQEHLAHIRKWLEPLFKAMPANAEGRVTQASVSYLVHAYFMRHRGWHLKGLGIDDYNRVSKKRARRKDDDMAVLEDSSSLLETLMEDASAHRGLSINDAAEVVATFERLARDDVFLILYCAYVLVDVDVSEEVDSFAFFDIASSFGSVWKGRSDILLAVREDGTLPPHAAESHASASRGIIMEWFARTALDDLLNDFYMNRHRLNPFKPTTLHFMDVFRLLERVMNKFAPLQDQFCVDMRGTLESMDPERTGRVPLKTFYGYNESYKQGYRFSESAPFLAKVGSLDESVPDNPKVLITNYVLGIENCLTSKSYFTWCCMSQCNGLMQMLETTLQAPRATPQAILDLLANETSELANQSAVYWNRLVRELSNIAVRNGGMVPLHGRLFGQWLHFAFPRDCPYPFSSKPVAHKRSELELFSDDTVETKHQDYAQLSFSQWSDDEMLPLNFDAPSWNFESCGRLFFAGVAVLAMLRILLQAMAPESACHKHRKMGCV